MYYPSLTFGALIRLRCAKRHGIALSIPNIFDSSVKTFFGPQVSGTAMSGPVSLHDRPLVAGAFYRSGSVSFEINHHLLRLIFSGYDDMNMVASDVNSMREPAAHLANS
jgi:hypothetical protein